MGRCAELTEMHDTTRSDVIRRDNARCYICGARNGDVHEIISRSAWACTDREMELCFSAKNRVCLCRKHHVEYQGDTSKSAALLIEFSNVFGYTYSEPEFDRFIRRFSDD